MKYMSSKNECWKLWISVILIRNLYYFGANKETWENISILNYICKNVYFSYICKNYHSMIPKFFLISIESTRKHTLFTPYTVRSYFYSFFKKV